MNNKFILLEFAMLLNWSIANSQIPVEIFAGQERTSFDVMFFKYFKNNQGENTRWLFFNRNRANVDSRMSTKTYLPQFGFTEAVSYNHPNLKGFAPVAVVQVLSWGVYPKAGIQFFHRKNDFTFFSWVVCETLKNPNLDFFVLTRYEPKLTKKLNLFTQLELVNAFPTNNTENFNLTQRVRLGLKIKDWQFGAGADFNETGNKAFTNINNIGGFLRHDF